QLLAAQSHAPAALWCPRQPAAALHPPPPVRHTAHNGPPPYQHTASALRHRPVSARTEQQLRGKADNAILQLYLENFAPPLQSVRYAPASKPVAPPSG